MDKTKITLPDYTRGEERLNAVSHGVGALFAVAGTIVMLICAATYSDMVGIVSSAIYGLSLIVLYAMSTLYHAVTDIKTKKILRVLDHSSVFLLIAGTYTPYTLVTIKGTMGWVIFGIVWGSAILGIALNAVSIEKFKGVSMILYIASGWAAVIGIKPIVENMAPNGVILLFLGGVFYTGGIVFYALKKHRYFHGIWHIFVLAGSVCHYFSLLFYAIMA